MGFFDRLVGRSSPSPETLALAESLMEERNYVRAWDLLEKAARRARFTTGPLVARLHANLGECAFQLGDAVRALAQTRKALRMADDDLRAAILGNVYEIYRYLGEPYAAAETAEQIAKLHPNEERRYLYQATLVRQGEPLLRIVADIAGVRHELDEVFQGIAGPVQLVYERNRLTLNLAESWTREGEDHAHAGNFTSSIERYVAAMCLDPFAPEPVYQAGFLRAHEGRWDEARDYFERVDRLAPGWFLSQSALSLIRLVPNPDLFRVWHAIAEGPLPHEAKRQLAEQALPMTPTEARAYFHHLHGKALQGLKRPEAERAFRIGLEHAAEPDLITRLCVDLATVAPSSQEKTRLLRRAVEINGDLVAVASARIVLAFE